jgi:hypothetical protein
MSAKAVPLLGAEKNSLALRFGSILKYQLISYTRMLRLQTRISFVLEDCYIIWIPARCELG